MENQNEIGIKAVKDMIQALDFCIEKYEAKLKEAKDLKIRNAITGYVVIVNPAYCAGIDDKFKPTLNTYTEAPILSHEQASRFNNIKPFISHDKKPMGVERMERATTFFTCELDGCKARKIQMEEALIKLGGE